VDVDAGHCVLCVAVRVTALAASGLIRFSALLTLISGAVIVALPMASIFSRSRSDSSVISS